MPSFARIFDPINILLFLGLLILLFLICREILCWYWKINKALVLLQKIEKNTRQKNLTTDLPKEDAKK